MYIPISIEKRQKKIVFRLTTWGFRKTDKNRITRILGRDGEKKKEFRLEHTWAVSSFK